MNLKIPYKWKFVIAIFVLLFLESTLFLIRIKNADNFYKVEKENLYCSIILDGRMYAGVGRPVGFNYELLQYYADYCHLTVNIDPPSPSPACWDSLESGKYDIIVMNTEKNPVPDDYQERIMLSIPVEKNIVWAVSKKNRNLLNSINFWLSDFKTKRQYSRTVNRYFHKYNYSYSGSSTISPYDDIIKKYSKFAGIDWRLVSSVAYEESHFFMAAESNKSAKGLMQVKESTAQRYGVDDLFDPDLNIKAGTLHLQYLFNMYKNEGLDSINVVKFALASYNAGEGKIQNCREFAAELGLNPNDWVDVTKSFSANPSFVGKQTIDYVNSILARYEDYRINTTEKEKK